MPARIDESRTFQPLRIAVLTVSDTRTAADDRSGDTLAERILAAGHELAGAGHRPATTVPPSRPSCANGSPSLRSRS